MSNAPQPARETAPRPAWEADFFTRYSTVILYGLAGVFSVVGIAAAIAWKKYDKNALPYLIWAVTLAVVDLVGALLASTKQTTGMTQRERERVFALASVGVLGFATAALGLTLPFAYKEIFGGPFTQWREHWGTVLLCAALLFGGLVIMFVGLQLGQKLTTAFPNLRRAVLGYNAITGTLVLVCILIVLNLLPYIQANPFKALNANYDWTTSRIFSLEPESKNVLTNLQQPVKIYVLITRSDPISSEVDTLLQNCKNVAPDKITVETLSRDLNRNQFAELVEKYQVPDSGVLVLYGTEPNITSEFIRRNDLYDDQSTGERSKFLFKGETALINAINYLSEGKSKVNLYITQGHGEPELAGGLMGRPGGERTFGRLREELEKRNFQVKALEFGIDAKVPEDADVVVVGGPQVELGSGPVKALRDFVHGTGRKNKGRLIVLMGPAADRKGSVIHTGLEPLLAEYNVKVGNDRVLTLDSGRDVTHIMCTVNPAEGSSNPVIRAFFSGEQLVPFYMDNARTVTPNAPAGPGAPPNAFTAEELVVTWPGARDWAETNLEAQPFALVEDLVKNHQQELLAKLARRPLSVAVAVSEGKSTPPPMMPGHPPLPSTEGQPRLVVYGDVTWATDRGLTGRFGFNQIDLFASSVSWLREKPTLGSSAAPKERNQFTLPTPSDGGWRLVLLPVGLVLMAVIMMGGGVWIIRRR